MPEDGLLEYAKLATKLRREFAQRAEVAKAKQTSIDSKEEEKKDFVLPKLNRAYDKKVRTKNPTDLMLGFESNKASMLRKRRKKKQLNIDELKEILRLVHEDGITQREAAERFGVKPYFVTNLVRNEKLKKNTVA